jgi:ankyrin repeat protein
LYFFYDIGNLSSIFFTEQGNNMSSALYPYANSDTSFKAPITALGKALINGTDEYAHTRIPSRFGTWTRFMDNGHNVLVLAIKHEKTRCIRALMGLNLPEMYNTVDESNHNPLMEAAFKGDLVALELLLAAGADPKIANKGGITPLHSAISFRVFGVYLLDESKRLEAEQKTIETIGKMVRMLARHGAIIDAKTTYDDNKTALQHHINFLAEPFVYSEVIACLVEQGADPTKIDRTNRNLTPELTQKIDDSVERGLVSREARPCLADNLQPRIMRYPYDSEPTLHGYELVDLVCSYV